MNFAVVGTLSSYVKTKNLTFAAKHKIRTGQTLTNSNGNFISMNNSVLKNQFIETTKTLSDKAKQAKLKRIKQKLMGGKELSEEELGFLRVNDPKTYSKAKHAKEAREELKAELKKAKSKSEAREAMTRAMIKASTEAMAELGALGQCGGLSGGGSPGNGSMTQGGELFSSGGDTSPMNISSDAGATDISGGEVSAEGDKNISGMENQSFSEINQSIQDADDKSSHDKNPFEQKNSDEDSNTPEDIMEKFIMTIRALEDEWARFTNSDEYKNLPENTLDEIDTDKKVRKQVREPNHKCLNAVAVYRRSMLYRLDD